MEIKVNSIINQYKVLEMIYDPEDNWKIKFICLNLNKNKVDILSENDMLKILKSKEV